MTTKQPWTDEEKFWRNIRQAALALVDAIETYQLSKHIEARTAEIRKRLKSYQRVHTFPPIVAEDMRERVVELTTEAECDKL